VWAFPKIIEIFNDRLESKHPLDNITIIKIVKNANKNSIYGYPLEVICI